MFNLTLEKNVDYYLKDTIDIFTLQIPKNSDEIIQFEEYLSADEIRKCEKFRFFKDKAECISSRGFLRKVLASYIQKKPEEIKFEYSSFGKPFIKDDAHNLKFNLSHSNGYAMIAIAESDEIGVDLEFIKSFDDLDKVAKDVFTKNELTIIAGNASVKIELFFKFWTRKESMIKALGKGLLIPLNQVDVSDLNTLSYSDSSEHISKKKNNFFIQDLNVPGGFAGAVAILGKKKKINYC